MISYDVLWLRCWFRMTLTVYRFELRNLYLFTQPAHHFCIEHLKKLDSFVKKLPYEDVYSALIHSGLRLTFPLRAISIK